MSLSSFRIPWTILIIVLALILVYSGVFADTAGDHEYPKPLGIWSLSVHDTIKVFDGHSIEACPADPSRDWSTSSPIPLNIKESTCYTCSPVDSKSVCDSSIAAIPAVTCPTPPLTCIPQAEIPASCAASHTEYKRNCELKESPYNHLLDGALFKPGAYWYGKNLECTNSVTVPDVGLVVTKDESKTYMWDNQSPICVRGAQSGVTSLGRDWISDAELKAKVASGIVGTTDDTLTYIDDGQIYITKQWTNRNVQAKWICSDAESGCNPLGKTIFSGPLDHLQTVFTDPSFLFIDNALNTRNNTIDKDHIVPFRDICQSNRAALIGINRSCRFEINPMKIIIAISANQIWYNDILSAGDRSYLTGIIAAPPTSNSLDFSNKVKKLRELSLSGSTTLRTTLGITTNPLHDLLYILLPGSCMYKLNFDPAALGPLIDKIKPTIEVSAEIGNGIFTPADTLLLKQEGTVTAWLPLTYTTGSYLAGSGVITVTITDDRASTFTPQSVWATHNGISWINTYAITVCRTKTHTGMILNTDCSTSPSHEVANSYSAVLGDYNSTWQTLVPHKQKIEITLSDLNPDGIQVIWEYQVYVAVLDTAGNANTGTAIFNIIPEWFDRDRTRLDKYSDASIETPSKTIYTITGSNAPVYGWVVEVDSYANAIDIQTYKLSIFDKYANPIINWNLYDFWLSQTGIYLDEVNKVGPSALFINASGGILSNSWLTGITNGDGALKFHILSYTPGKFFEQFNFKYKNWDRNGHEIGPIQPDVFPNNTINTPLTWKFNHIFTGSVDLYTTNRVDLGTSNDVRMDFFTTSDTQNITLTWFTVSNFLETIKSVHPDDFTVTATGTYNSWFIFDTYYPYPSYLSGATGSFVPEQKGTLFSSGLEVKASPYITLTFSGYTTQYFVSDRQAIFGSGITYGTGKLNRIYIDGMTSAVGKTGYVNAKDIVGVSTADTRNAIHKNVALLLRNREITAGWWIINRVKYLTGDVKSSTLWDISSWDVLIIKGGNFIIGDDYAVWGTDFDSRNYYFNNGTTSLESVAHKGIIVLKDDVTGSGGYIYIKPDVRFIGASLFADESIMSVKYTNSEPFDKSNSARTFLLNKQLIIFGSVLSKNTVGGAVRADSNWKYTLPWKNTTVSLDDAVRYDLSFLRMDHFGYDPSSYMSRGHEEFVVILIDPRNVSNPLPGFLIK